MSTRGLYGFRKDGVDKCTYNHSDSYPSGLGEDVLKFCSNNSIKDLNNLFDNIIMVNENDKPTEEQIKICKENGFANFSVSTCSEDDWYCLLRNLQGNFDAYQECIDNDFKLFMTNGIDFITDSLFCEYGYIVNLDTEMLEFYEGFQKEPQKDNRYGIEECRGYYPCKLVLEIPLDEIDDIDYWEKIMEYGSEEAVVLKEKWGNELYTDEIKELVDNDKTNICGIYKDYEDVGESHVDNCEDISDYIKNFIDFEALGKDIVEDTSEWYELESGKIVHLC